MGTGLLPHPLYAQVLSARPAPARPSEPEPLPTGQGREGRPSRQGPPLLSRLPWRGPEEGPWGCWVLSGPHHPPGDSCPG